MRHIQNLSYETQNLLKRLYKHSKKHDVRQRAQCIILSHKGLTINHLIEIFDVHLNTIYNWLNNWDNSGLLSLYNSKGQGRKMILQPEDEEFIRKSIKKNSKQVKKVVVELDEKKGIKVSERTVKRFLKKKLNMIWKRVRKSLRDRRPDDYEEKKEELKKLVRLEQLGELNLFYADGSGFSLTPCVPYAWQEIGSRIEIPSTKSKTLNLFGIWDAKINLELFSVEGSLTSEIVIKYIDSFCENIEGRNVIVIDNASIHVSKAFKNKRIEWNSKGLEIFYLPTYSPHLNLIEHLWRFMKYEWIEFKAYKSWENLVEYIEKIAENFGTKYTINFV